MEYPSPTRSRHVAVIILAVLAFVIVGGIFYYKYGLSFDNNIVVKNVADQGGLTVVPEGSSPSAAEQNDLQNNSVVASNNGSQGQNTQSGTNSQNTSGDTNNTTQLSQNFINQYIALEESTTTPSPAQEQALANNVTQQTNVDLTYKTYTSADLTLETTENPASLTAYGDAIGQAIISPNNNPVGLETELVIVGNALDTNEASALAPLDIHIQIYQNLIAEFTKMGVPPSALALHLQMLNDTSQLESADIAMKSLTTDPVTATAGLNLYNNAANSLITTFGQYASYFSAKGVIFATSSPGYAFTHLEQ